VQKHGRKAEGEAKKPWEILGITEEKWKLQLLKQEGRWARNAKERNAITRNRQTKAHNERLALIKKFVLEGMDPFEAIHKAVDRVPLDPNQAAAREESDEIFITAADAVKERELREKHNTEPPKGITEEEWRKGIEEHTAALKRKRRR